MVLDRSHRSPVLRAFLLLRLANGSWNVWVCQDLSEIGNAWAARPHPESSAGVLHLGFEFPDPHSFEELAAGHPGCLLVTGAALHGLPESSTKNTAWVGSVRGIPVHLVARGAAEALWEVSVHQPEPRPRGWLAEFLAGNPSSRQAVLEAGIADEVSYLEREALLEPTTRRDLGRFRARTFAAADPRDPTLLARAAPPWLIDRPLSKLALRARVAGVFSRMGLRTVRDLSERLKAELLDQRNFGTKSCQDAVEALEAALALGPPQAAPPKLQARAGPGRSLATPTGPPQEETPLLAHLRAEFGKLEQRERSILASRVGFNVPPGTLEAIGADFGLSRERVRQIAANAANRILTNASWVRHLGQRVADLTADKRGALALTETESVDPWFAGISAHSAALAKLLKMAPTVAVEVIEIKGAAYFSKISQSRWDAAVAAARELLQRLAEERAKQEYCRQLVGELLPEEAEEFAELLWQIASRECHFVADQRGERVLSRTKHSTEHFVLLALERSLVPLHFAELAKRTSRLAGREVDVRRVQNLAAKVGLLFGNGKYGLHRHLPWTDSQLAAVRQSAEEIVLAGPEGRQWHASEILADLEEMEDYRDIELDKYLVSIALRESEALEDLGRMIWVARTADGTAQDRIALRNSVVAILERAEGPLPTSEIKARLAASRGLNTTFQIQPDAELIRVAPGVWGLNDRDVGVRRERQPVLVERLVQVLEEREVGLHVSEIARAVRAEGIPPEALRLLAAQDSRVSSAPGGYVYLAKWGDARRESARKAILAVLRNASAPLPLQELRAQASARLGREVKAPSLSNVLVGAGAIYDPDAKTWSAPPPERDEG